VSPRAARAADPETARLLRELNDAGYWAEHLILTGEGAERVRSLAHGSGPSRETARLDP
jgi:hypothetical protein